MSSEINITVNGNQLDNNVFSDAPAQIVSFSLEHGISYAHYIEASLRPILGISAFFSDLYLIVVISKVQNLQTRLNKFILQYVIFNMLYLVLDKVLFIILSKIIHSRFNANYYFISNFDHLLLTLCFYVVTFMALDWYVLNCQPNIYKQYPKIFKYGAYILYVLAIPTWIVTSTLCYINDDYVEKYRFYLEAVSFLVCFITVIYITILKRLKSLSSKAKKTEYSLILSRTVLMLSLFFFIFSAIYFFLLHSDNMYFENGFYASLAFKRIGELFIIATPSVVLCRLIKSNKHFRSACIKSYKRNKVYNYSSVNLEENAGLLLPPKV